MAKIGWGKPLVEVCQLTNGAVPTTGATYKAVPTPKKDSLSLNTTKGEEKVAEIEGGEIIDVRYNPGAAELVYDLHVVKGETIPFTHNDGVVAEEYAVRVAPEDSTCEGFEMLRTAVSIQEMFTAQEGKIWRVTHKALKPASGNRLKPYTKGA